MLVPKEFLAREGSVNALPAKRLAREFVPICKPTPIIVEPATADAEVEKHAQLDVVIAVETTKIVVRFVRFFPQIRNIVGHVGMSVRLRSRV